MTAEEQAAVDHVWAHTALGKTIGGPLGGPRVPDVDERTLRLAQAMKDAMRAVTDGRTADAIQAIGWLAELGEVLR
jgi:hypothetical protein